MIYDDGIEYALKNVTESQRHQFLFDLLSYYDNNYPSISSDSLCSAFDAYINNSFMDFAIKQESFPQTLIPWVKKRSHFTELLHKHKESFLIHVDLKIMKRFKSVILSNILDWYGEQPATNPTVMKSRKNKKIISMVFITAVQSVDDFKILADPNKPLLATSGSASTSEAIKMRRTLTTNDLNLIDLVYPSNVIISIKNKNKLKLEYFIKLLKIVIKHENPNAKNKYKSFHSLATLVAQKLKENAELPVEDLENILVDFIQLSPNKAKGIINQNPKQFQWIKTAMRL